MFGFFGNVASACNDLAARVRGLANTVQMIDTALKGAVGLGLDPGDDVTGELPEAAEPAGLPCRRNGKAKASA